MEWKLQGSEMFVRLDPGDRMVESIDQVAKEAAFSAGAIISGVGMLSRVTLGFFDVDSDDYVRTEHLGIYDLSSVLGNIVQRDGAYSSHIHVVFNDPQHRTFSGHLIEAICHITVELFISTSKMVLNRVKVPNCPATRIVFQRGLK